MQISKIVHGAVIIGCLAAGGIAGMAMQQPDGGKKDGQDGAVIGAEAGAQPDMQAWMKSMTPGPQHGWLKRFEGEWDVSFKMYMDPSAPPMEAKAEISAKSILGGRFIEEAMTSSMMGMPWEGKGMTGYDNNRKMFVTTWADTMGTGIMRAYGNLDKTGKILTMVGQMDEPMTGEIGKSYMMRTTVTGPDTHTFEVIEILYGEPFTVVKGEYVRKK